MRPRKTLLMPKARKSLEILGQNLKLARIRRRISAAMMCERANVSHATTPAYTYLWNGGGMVLSDTTTSGGNGTVSTVTAALLTNYVSIYTVGVKVTDSKGCSAQASPVTITVDNPTVKLSVIEPQTICAGTTATFTAQTTGVNGTQGYKWMNAAGDSLTNTQSYQTSDALVGGTYAYRVVAYATVGGCTKTDTTTATLTVLEPQVSLVPMTDTTICLGGSADLEVTLAETAANSSVACPHAYLSALPR